MANTPRLGRQLDRPRMVVGFAFLGPNLSRVALIRKVREPEGAGMIDSLNGIGGRVLKRETYIDGMTREFHQEAGVIVRDWLPIAIIEGPTYRLMVYATELKALWRRIGFGEKSPTDEEVVSVNAKRLPDDVYADLRFLIPMSIEYLDNGPPPRLTRFDRRDI